MKKELFDYSSTKKRILYPILIPIGRFLVKFIFKTTLIGVENVPKDGKFIFASNHITMLDPVFIATLCPRTLYFMAKQELFKNGFVRWFLTNMNAFPINRDGYDTRSMDYAERLLSEGNAIGIFPEGTRQKSRRPGRAKAGVAVLAKATKASVVPVSVYFSKKPSFRSKLTVRIGEPIAYEEFNFTDDERNTRELRDAASLVMERITKLWEKQHSV
ncbi:MAG: 1-acyl-sn-glycerol-3-phosphate acyltransferase [Clostridia bacterium]|nr:1-acyl-sn-glycerol-3-phosphate acyltransferase [Clostridia bacterium]